MAQEKQLNTIIKHLHGSVYEWEDFSTFIPLNGELVIYDSDSTSDCAKIKIGDGQTRLSNLPFLNEEISNADIDKICS